MKKISVLAFILALGLTGCSLAPDKIDRENKDLSQPSVYQDEKSSDQSNEFAQTKNSSEDQKLNNKKLDKQSEQVLPLEKEKEQNQEEKLEPEIDLSDWREFHSKIAKVDFKFHKNWYYQQYTGAEAENYIIYFAFSEDPSEVAGNPPFPIAFGVVGGEYQSKAEDHAQEKLFETEKQVTGNLYQWQDSSQDYAQVIFEQENKTYIFQAHGQENVQVMKAMAQTFELKK